ncbi:MAG: hypothetical protein J7M08_07625 [Planctomycetes bacterium]|nr:hypothetical protein [Planctomycetota bacterium]
MKRAFFLSCALGLIVTAGCASATSSLSRNVDFSAIQRVAVVDVKGPLGDEGVRNYIADLFSAQLLSKGYQPLERRQIKSVLGEQEFQSTDFTSPQGVARVGQIRNVDAILLVNVAVYSSQQVALTTKLLDVETGDIIWMGSGDGQTGETIFTAAGAAAGGALGWKMGGSNRGKKVAGVAGAVVGGASGQSLSPKREAILKKIVVKIMRHFPQQR